ncbi:MAG: DUF4388 domain-containing protein [Sumerlaeia bacterium]
MAHRSLSTIQFVGFSSTTASTLISMMGDEGLPNDIRIVSDLTYHPWTTSRSGLIVMSMSPSSDLTKISNVIQDRTTWWEVAVCLMESINAYQPALLAQGAVKVLTHPEDDLSQCRQELRDLLSILTVHGTDLLGLELSDLIQLYGEKRVPKTIRINAQGVIGSLYLRDGLLVHAETMDETTGMEAFSRLFGAKSPELRVHNGCLTNFNTLNMPVMSVLLEGARVNDEGIRDNGSRSSYNTPTPMPTMQGLNTPRSGGLPNHNDFSGALDDILGDFDVPKSNATPKPKRSNHTPLQPAPTGNFTGGLGGLGSDFDMDDDLDELD